MKINNFENYNITEDGNITNSEGKTLKQHKSKSGYMNVHLYNQDGRKGFRVNRLVAISFIKNELNKQQVNHIDGNKLNNNVINLEWCTASENMRHAHDNNLVIPKKGYNNERSKEIKCTDKNGKVSLHANTRYLCDELGLHRGCVLMCLSGKRTHHRNYTFEYN